ncbi:hypothetical protein ACFVIY_17835 [Streptomyces sp. NPDC127166]|uniref:hypothetical protein n=1 Tax=Streptomyces sp. NPDC127166 TaxID=3345380 RepID=UPI003631E586
MRKTAPITVDGLIAEYAADVAFAAEKTPATILSDFIDQLHTAYRNLTHFARISLADLDTAVTYLEDAENSADATEKQVLLAKAAEYMRDIPDAVDEYRLMV